MEYDSVKTKVAINELKKLLTWQETYHEDYLMFCIKNGGLRVEASDEVKQAIDLVIKLIESQDKMIDFILEKICFVGAEDIFSETCLKCSKSPKRISECIKHIKIEIRKKLL